jgi:hypothetical protein
MNISFLEEKREVSFDWHIHRVQRWLEYDGGRKSDSIVVYASVELRCAIERYFFELLVLLKRPDKLTSAEEKRCQSKNGVLDLMKEIEPYYRKRATFTNLIAAVRPGVPKVLIVDIKYLIRVWSELSIYCHKQLRPEKSWDSVNREFQENGFKLINEVVNQLKVWEFNAVFGIIDKESMPTEVRSVYDKYINNKIDEGQAKRMLDLMGPVLRARRRYR